MRTIMVLFACLLSIAFSPGHADRYALVIGIADYSDPGVSDLRNAVNDANAVADSLRGANFDVTLIRNVSKQEIDDAFNAFVSRLDQAPRGSTALVYFAGHGIQNGDDMYLFASDIPISSHANAHEIGGVYVGNLVEKLNSTPTKLRMLFFDACRTEFDPVVTRNLSISMSAASTARPKSDTLIVYSTSEGQVALDGTPLSQSPYSPFAEAAINLFSSNQDLSMGIQQLLGEVARLTRDQQVPMFFSSVKSRFQFIVGGEQGRFDAALEAEKSAWSDVRASEYSRIQLSMYLENYPGGLYEEEARSRLDMLASGVTNAVNAVMTPSNSQAISASRAQRGLADYGLTLMVSEDQKWMVSDVESATPFFGKIRSGDELWKVNGKTMDSASQAAELIYKSLAEDGRVGLVVRRFGQPYSVTIR